MMGADQLAVQRCEDAGFARVLHLALPATAPGRWMHIHVQAGTAAWWAKLELEDAARGQVVRENFLGPLRHGRRSLLLHVPADAGAMRLQVYGEAHGEAVHARVLGRWKTALLLGLAGAGQLSAVLRGGPFGLANRVRAALGQAPARQGVAPPYAMWLTLFPTPAPAPPARRDVQLVIVGQDDTAIEASLASAGGIAAGACVVRQAADWSGALAPRLLVLGAGERLAPDAPLWFATTDADAVYADIDYLDAAGTRCNPLFKPGPGMLLLRSGFLTTGACLFRRPPDVTCLPDHVEAARLALALQAAHVARIPHILTHVPLDNRRDAKALVEIVQADLRRTNAAGMAESADAFVRIKRPRPANTPGRISLIVPSACKSAHVLHCMRRVAYGTVYADYEILLAVTDILPGNARQARLLRRLAALPRMRILNLGMSHFNYATANNRAAEAATGDMLLLLNDDVAPIAPDWLSCMAAFLKTKDVGAVGVRLLYGNNTVQHGGVVMGLANLCEHADRFRPADDVGLHGLAGLAREVSAVTAACMLVRNEVFCDLGGLDEEFAIALNDVDFCMRLRELSLRIIYAANVTLYHYESMSLGRHYAGPRAGLEGVEVHRLRARWAAAIADDPYYNPNASLEPARLWQPGFPPRAPWQAGKGSKIAAPQ